MFILLCNIKSNRQEKAVIPHLNKEDVYVLATDLDGTFLNSKNSQTDALYNFIKDNPNVLLVYVTGRNPRLITTLFDEDPHLPKPEYMIGDVGATVLHGETLAPVSAVQDEIEAKWKTTLNDISDIPLGKLEVQDQPQARRKSFYVDPDIQEDMDAMKQVFDDLQDRNCDVLYSNAIYLDILPKGVNKGSTLRSFIDHLGLDHEKVLTAGDTMNDESMLLNAGYRSVVLKNSEPRLHEAADLQKDNPLIYRSQADGTDGILEALAHFKMANAHNYIQDQMPALAL